MYRVFIFVFSLVCLAHSMENCQVYYEKAKEAYQAAPIMAQNHENKVMGVAMSVEQTRYYYKQYRNCIQNQSLALKTEQ